MIRTCLPNIPTFISHEVGIPPCCPVSGNPLNGSKLRISYYPDDIVLPVELLKEWVDEYIGGHPNGLREMESMIQEISERVFKEVQVPVKTTANLIIQPPYGGPVQKLNIVVRSS